MKIAYASIYDNLYGQDRVFDEKSCNIGQNLLYPIIKLRDELNKLGHSLHTADLYHSFLDVDYIIFADLSPKYLRVCNSLRSFARYIYKRGWKSDYLNKAIKEIPLEKRLLVIAEPPSVIPTSYDKKYHKFFHKVLTWNDDLADGRKYIKYCIPQPVPNIDVNEVAHENKRFLTMICGNKSSKYENELYSERKKIIEFCEKHSCQFDLYGFGWENCNYSNYKGTVADKLQVLSNYKYSICYENMCNINGYITEKIFDCFFSHCVPVYYGAENITDYIPKETFIDARNFSSIHELISCLNSISLEKYREYIYNARQFIVSSGFKKQFSVDAYVNSIIHQIL